MQHTLHHPLSHLDTDALEHAASTFMDFVGDVGDLADDVVGVVTETVTEEIVPAVGTTVRRTRRVVRSHPRTALAAALGALAVIGFVIWWRRRDTETELDAVTGIERAAA